MTSSAQYIATLSGFNQLLIWHPGQSAEEWAEGLLQTLCKQLHAYQGVYYHLSEQTLRPLATYACIGQAADFPLGEGLVGQTAADQRTRLLRELPADYFSPLLGSLSLRPDSLLLLPLVFNQQTQGVLEFSFLHTPEEQDLQLLELLAPSIAASLKNLQQEMALRHSYQELELRHQQLLEASKERELLQQLQRKNQQIHESMQYARRIQERMLPEVDALRTAFPGMLYYYRCRDVVSGDFHWFLQHEGLTFLACVDCTGHGVPGALMSMLGNLLLDRIVRQEGEQEPDRILAKLDAQIISTLRQADESGRDGMDIGLCVFDGRTVRYAGAGRPLWVVRQGQLKEYKGAIYSAGGLLGNRQKHFDCHSIELLPGDMCYLSSDGFQDQFSEHGRRYSKRRLKTLLTELSTLPVEVQEQRLDQAFCQWQGNTIQIDDVLVMGVRV